MWNNVSISSKEMCWCSLGVTIMKRNTSPLFDRNILESVAFQHRVPVPFVPHSRPASLSASPWLWSKAVEEAKDWAAPAQLRSCHPNGPWGTEPGPTVWEMIYIALDIALVWHFGDGWAPSLGSFGLVLSLQVLHLGVLQHCWLWPWKTVIGLGDWDCANL